MLEREAEPRPSWITTLRERLEAGERPPDPAAVSEVTTLTDVRLLAEGMAFAEGPVAMADGGVLVCEGHTGRVLRVGPNGDRHVVAEVERSANGAAIGPDGALYVCDNGRRPPHYLGGQILRIDIDSGDTRVLYDSCDGTPLRSPNDLVFERSGRFWFTDFGGFRNDGRPYGALFCADPDGNHIVQAAGGLDSPNGIGLSPDESTLYWAETVPGRLYRRAIVGPGRLEHGRDHDPYSLLCGLPGVQLFDSLAVDADGNICVGTLLSGRITAVSADGGVVRQYEMPPQIDDLLPTNICFGGEDLTTAYITLAETGSLAACRWPRPGLPLAFNR